MSGNIRQELYDRIRESSKDEVILAEMIRLGYWPQNTGMPSAPEALIKRNGEISRALSELYTKQQRWADPERVLKEMHKERKRAAMERRKATKLRNAQERYERALAWAERKKGEIAYLGDGVSAGLTHGAEARAALLPGLPVIANAKALAAAMGMPLGELRFLAYERALSRVSHYQRFLLPKKTGGYRQISAPMPRLKAAQYWILDNILAKVPVHDAAHGFAPGRSILTNAAPHAGRDVVVNLDMKDFFPTLSWRRVRGKFRGLGYSEGVATVLALVCTEPDIDEVELDGQRLYLRKGPRRLPQGAPTSPALTNLICSRLDKRLSGLAAKLGFTYTRYADDMTFSASGEAAGKVGTLLKAVGEIVTAEGFTVHPDKTRIMRKHRRQEVTGLVVNNGVGVPRDTLRRFRALIHQIEHTGLEGKSWGTGGNVLTAALGFAHFVRMVDVEAGVPLVAKVEALAKRHGATLSAPERTDFRAKAATGQQPLPRWWKPAEPEAPRPDPVLNALEREQELAQQREQQRLREAQVAEEQARRNPPVASVPSAGSRRSGFAEFVRRTEGEPTVDASLRALFASLKVDRVCSDALQEIEARFAGRFEGQKRTSLATFLRNELAWSKIEPRAIEAYRKHFSTTDIDAYQEILRAPFGAIYVDKFIPAFTTAFVRLNAMIDQRVDLIVDAISDETPLPGPMPVPAPANSREQAARAFVSTAVRDAYDAQMAGMASNLAGHENGDAIIAAIRDDMSFEAYVVPLGAELAASMSEADIVTLHRDWNRAEWQALLQKQRSAERDFRIAFQGALQPVLSVIMSGAFETSIRANTLAPETSSMSPGLEPQAVPPPRRSILSAIAKLFTRRRGD